MKKRQNILITGASSGLGAEMALQFAAKGRNLALCARRIKNLEKLKAEIEEKFPNVTVTIRKLNVNNHTQVFETFQAFKKDLGTIDRIIVNAGIARGGSVGTGLFDENKKTAVTNFTSALAQCEAAIEIFREQNHGHLVTISSISALRGFRRSLTVYAASKSALTTLSEGIRVDLLGTPIKVTTIHPGFIRTEMNAKTEKTPLIVDTPAGVKSIIKAIEKEVDNAFVPEWPWKAFRHLVKIAPLSILKFAS